MSLKLRVNCVYANTGIRDSYIEEYAERQRDVLSTQYCNTSSSAPTRMRTTRSSSCQLILFLVVVLEMAVKD